MYNGSFDNPTFKDDTISEKDIVNPPFTEAEDRSPSGSVGTSTELEMEEIRSLPPVNYEGTLPKENGSKHPVSVFIPPCDPSAPPAFEENAAVCVRNAFKSYQKGNPVLSDFNMTVPAGTIYSLLGSSGCGKTTLLSCCVGIRNLDKGEIRLFGHKPGSKDCGVPGRRVGYMPQELSLYGQLTIQEALNFYGRIYGLQRQEMETSVEFLIQFLDLPIASRKIASLSGGQKRRVSIAISLIHDPELLILDEPTVGVDPLLRESIWKHLVKLVSKGTTVIITTHYVEEARQSNVVGIMRNGRLLAEKSPQALLEEFRVSHLEDIVLTLCRMDREDKQQADQDPSPVQLPHENNDHGTLEWTVNAFMKRKAVPGELTLVEAGGIGDTVRYSSSTPTTTVCEDPEDPIEVGDGEPEENGKAPQMLVRRKRETRQQNESTRMTRLMALLIKNFIILMRNVGFLIFIFLVPAVQIILICLTIGSDPRGLLIGVVNSESCDFEGPNWRNIKDSCPVDPSDLANGTLSCFFLAHLPEESFILEREPTAATALIRIQSGYTYGYIQFPEDYTSNVVCKFGGICSKEDKDGPNIIFEMDMSNKQIGQTMKRIFVDSYSRTVESIKSVCKKKLPESILQASGDIPYVFKKPVYGKDDTSFREFLAPSILLGLLFFFPLCSSGVSYITEKKTGTLDRSIVAGVGTAELMGGFLIAQMGVLLGQAGFAFLILTQVFRIEILGSMSLTLSLTILVGISGMSAGFLLAMFCSEEIQAVLLAIGMFFPNILLAGMVWPLEGMDKILQSISYLLPCTLACESMRSIISRGWTFTHRSVWPGFATTLAWILVYWVLSILVHRIRSRG